MPDPGLQAPEATSTSAFYVERCVAALGSRAVRMASARTAEGTMQEEIKRRSMDGRPGVVGDSAVVLASGRPGSQGLGALLR